MKRQLTMATATVRTLTLSEREGLGVKGVDGEEDHGAFEVILSTPDIDREGEEVKAEEWQLPLPDHITFDHDHGMSVASTVGSGVPTLEGDQLVVRGTFASTDLAQNVRTLVKESHIRTTSVAFMRKSVTVDGEQVIRRELLNGAFVAVPANPAAVVRSTKALTGAEDDQDDVAAAKAFSNAVRKAIGGSFEERQQAVQHAIDRLYRRTSTYAYLVGTTETDAVWRTWTYGSDDDSDRAEWRADYTVGTDKVVTLGVPVQVRVVEVVTEVVATDAGASTATATTTAKSQVRGSHAPETAPAAPAQKAAVVEDQAAVEAEEKAKALATLALQQSRLQAVLVGAGL